MFFYRGLNGATRGSGGGAGGSVLLSSRYITGFGTIDVRGGNGGYYSGGGGSGGMVAMNYRSITMNLDILLAGGNGAWPGASGLLNEQKSEDKNTFSKLTLDNQHLSSNNELLYTVLLCQNNQIDYVFDELNIKGRACLTMRSCSPGRPMTLVVNRAYGDNTGSLIINSNHDVYISVTGVDLPELVPSYNIEIKSGGTLSVPKRLVIDNGSSLTLAGSLVGVRTLAIGTNGRVSLDYPGHTGYRMSPQGGFSACSFEKIHVKSGGYLVTKSPGRVRLSAKIVQLDYGSHCDDSSRIPLSTEQLISLNNNTPLNRKDCPHGYEVVALASKTLFNPCGTGKHIYTKSIVPYIVQHNISRTMQKVVWKDVDDGNGTLIRVSSLFTWITFEIKYETRYNVTYYIACDYTDFVLLPGQSCTFQTSNYTYRSLEIHNGAVMKFKASQDKDTIAFLKTKTLTVYVGGTLQALTSDFIHKASSSTNGGTFGGLGGGDNNIDNLYGNMFYPKRYGSSGSGTVSHRGAGGGALVLDSQTIILDGNIEANGGHGIYLAGGGSGGSILIMSNRLFGKGLIKATGGRGSNSGGGGGGGRIAVHANQPISVFRGNYDVSGGSGKTVGSSGTVVLRDTSKGTTYDVLVFQNRGTAPSMLPLSSNYTFDELRIASGALFSTGQQPLSIKKLVTDGTGKIVVPKNGLLDVQFVDGLKNEIKCDIEVQKEGILNINGETRFNGPGSPNALIQGLLQVRKLSIAEGKQMTLARFGEAKTENITLLSGSVLNVHQDSVISRFDTRFLQNISSLVLKTNSRLKFISSDVKFHTDYLYLSKGAQLTTTSDLKLFNISALNIVMESEATIDASGGGLLKGPGTPITSGFGCGHGGEGGGLGGGKAYGSVFEPRYFGSGNTVRGGGIVHIVVKDTFVLDGLVHSNGQSNNYGGASGGSILIKVNTLKGHGEIQTSGGNADMTSGGGSGGRIALYIANFRPFQGLVSSFGGGGGRYGAPGTVFIREFIVGVQRNTTIVDNNKHATSSKTKIMHGSKTSYIIGKLRLVDGATLEIATISNAQMDIKVNELDGDGSGKLHIRPNQTVTLSASKAVTPKPFMFPWAMVVEEGASLKLSPRVLITQTQSKPSLYLAGRLVGGQEVNVANGASVVITKTGMIGTLNAFPGKFFFRSLKVSSGGKIRFETDVSKKVPVLVESVSIDVAFGGTMVGSYLHVKTPHLNVAFNGTMHANSLGHGANQGFGAGSMSTFSGGSYGGCESLGKCKIYGSLYKPTNFGSGGGGIPDLDPRKGSGGGILQVESDILILDGIISSDGGNGQDKLGGGSGGSVDVAVTKRFSGRGSLTANGGNGYSRTGSGSGGRVTVLVTGEYGFSGTMFSKGGQSSIAVASPGTVYIEELHAGFRSRQLILDNSQKSSLSSVPVYLGKQNIASYFFDVFTLLGKVTLHLDTSMLIHKLVSNEESTIHVQDNVTLEIEPTSEILKPSCNFQVDRQGEIRLPDTVSFLGNNNIFSGTLTGVLNLLIGVNRKTQFLQSARIARFVDGKYTFMTKRGEYRFSTLKIKKNAKVSFENARLQEISLTVGILEINYQAVLFGSWLRIRSGKIIINPGGKLDLSGQGYLSKSGPGFGSCIGSTSTGAGHGGYGAFASGNFGLWYGSALNPNISGSGGGSCSSANGGSGGGLLHLQVVNFLLVNGEITTDGEDGETNSGGGSGGSIFISTKEIKGNGLITSSGGSSSGGGGGSGGRIAFYVKEAFGFEGEVRTFGGTGASSSASGTVFIMDDIDQLSKKQLWMVNRKFSGNLPITVLAEPSASTVYFDELKILGSVRFEIESLSNQEIVIKIDEFVADGAGEIAIKAKQTMYAKVLESKETHLTMNTNVHIEEGGNMVAASNVTVDGATLTVDGRLSNVRHLVVEANSRVQFGIKSQTTQMEGKNFVHLSQPGTQQFATVTLKSGSDFGAPQNLTLSAQTLDLKNGVLLKGRFVDISVQRLLIGRGASLSTNTIVSKKRYIGEGQSSIKGGSGGGHGSIGGQSKNKIPGGKSYGTIYTPHQPGNPGGDGPIPLTGGKGGGVIKISTDYLWNDGSITSNGGNAAGTDAGGGSGGSVYITVKKSLQGSGMISADGGSGDGSGGCGAGGRVSLVLDGKFTFIGKLQALGGKSSTLYQSGGPGTVYIQEIRNKLKFNQLHIDNRGQSWNQFVTLQEESSNIELNELYMIRNASLRLSIDQTNRQLRILRLLGDRSGLLHLYKNHKVHLESQLPVTKPPINIIVESEGDLVLPQKCYIIGSAHFSLALNGTLSGVTDLYVTQNKRVKLNKGAHSSGHSAGTFQLSSIKLYSGSAVTMEDETLMNILVGHLNIKFHASLSAHHFTILASTIDVETGGLLSASGHNNARTAAPPQSTSSLPQGTGAGHATAGGRGKSNVLSTYHGSLFYPNSPGEHGGDGLNSIKGGLGGGVINITAGTYVIIDGTITIAGGHAVAGSGAGGGSGGSLLIKTNLFKGKIDVCKFTDFNIM